MTDLKSIKDEQWATFFGDQDDYYLNVVDEVKAGKIVVFNVYAFFFGLCWMLYRRMYLLCALAIGFLYVENWAEELVFALYFPSIADETRTVVSNLVWASAVGCFANWFYVQHARRQISKVLEQQQGEEQALTEIEAKGGISWMPIIVILSLVLFSLIMMRFSA
jgi:hypothetical protein